MTFPAEFTEMRFSCQGGLVLRLIQNVSCHVCVDTIVEVPVIKAVGSFVSLGLVLCNKYTTHKVDPEEFSTKL